jgi:predicted peptidase
MVFMTDEMTDNQSISPKIGQHAYSLCLGTISTNYLLYLPDKYGVDQDRRWPLMVFLHGISKRGDTIEELETLKLDGPPMIVADRDDFPFILLSPQCPSDSFWPAELDSLDAMLAYGIENFNVDPERIYLTGLSMGGFGAWHWILRHPSRFAACAPIAGGYKHGSRGVPDNICDLRDQPIWAFHGGADDVVLPYQSEVLVDALRACGSAVRYTCYPDADHAESWKRAYADPELYRWLLGHKSGN